MNNLLLIRIVQLIHMEYLYSNQQKTFQEIHLWSLIKKKTLFRFHQIIYIQVYFDHIFQRQVDVYLDQPN
jgi:hypothetical protein